MSTQYLYFMLELANSTLVDFISMLTLFDRTSKCAEVVLVKWIIAIAIQLVFVLVNPPL